MSLPHELQVLVGPAGGGKTAHLARRYAACIAAARQAKRVPRLLWLTPHRLAGERVRELLVSAGVDAALAPGIKTMGRFAEAVVSLDAAAPAVLPRGASRWLLHQTLAQLHAGGRLEGLALVADRPGLLDAVEQMLGELKTRGITAAKFATWAKSQRRRPRDGELSRIYTAYQQQLDAAAAADRFDTTRLAVESIDRQAIDPWDLLVVDGFASFDYYQRQLLTRLLGRTPEAWIALATVDPHDREELTATARRTLAWVTDEWPDAELVEVDQSPTAQAASIAHMAATIFLPPVGEVDLPAAALAIRDRVQLIVAADAYDEAVQVARRVKSLLLNGTPAADIVVAAAALEASQRQLDEVFDTFGIPVSFGTQATVGDDPAVRALAGVLALEAEDWPFRRVVATVTSGKLARLDLASDQGPWRTARGAAEWLVRELQVARGRRTLVDQVQRLADSVGQLAAPPSRLASAAVAAQPIVAQLATACESLPRRASPWEWTEACAKLAIELGLQGMTPSDEAWQQVREAAAWIERTATDAKLPAVLWSLSEWLGELSQWMGWLPSSTRLDEEGRVRVYGPQTARFASPRHLFLFGLDEKSFTTVASSGGIYSEKQYDELAAAETSGRRLTATPSYERAMQLFHDLVRSPGESLTMSFAALDSGGQAEPPSQMLAEACRTLGNDFAEQLSTTPAITALPPANEAPRSLRDWRLSAVHQALDGRPALLGAFLQSQLAKPANNALAAALATLHHRVRGDSFGPMEGILAGPAAKTWFAEQYGSDHQWSTSQLETYATCPYKFFMKNVLKIEPLGEIALETDYRRRGSLLHRALGELHARLTQLDAGVRQPSQHDAEAFQTALAAAIEAAREQFAGFGIEGVLNELLVEDVKKWTASYHQQHQAYDQESQHFDQALTPAYFELRFGKPSRHAEDDEAADSTDEPFVLDLGDGLTIRIGGRIDRVDTGRVGNTTVFQIIDYKSSGTFTMNAEKLNDGRQLQPAVYAMAAAEILSTDQEQAIALKSGYWLVQQRGFAKGSTQQLHTMDAGEVRPTDEWQQLQPVVRQRIGELVEGVRHGEFPMHSPVDDCTSHCEYSHVCRIGQVRSLHKVWPPPPPVPEEES